VQAIGRQPQRAPDGAPVHCERHSPERITPYRLVQQHAASFIAHTEAAPAVNCRDTSRMRSTPYSSLVPQKPRRFRRLMDGMVLRIGGHDWRCVADYGHAPERVALHAPALNMLISGDMVPPRLSTNVGVIDIELEADLLPLFLASIDRMRALPAGTLVLPSHGKPFGWLHERIAQLAAHHEERFANVLAACAEGPKSAAGRAVQAQARPAPDDVRDRGVVGPPARADAGCPGMCACEQTSAGA